MPPEPPKRRSASQPARAPRATSASRPQAAQHSHRGAPTQAFLPLPLVTTGESPAGHALVLGFELVELGRADIEHRLDEAGRLCALLAHYAITGFRATYALQFRSSPAPLAGARGQRGTSASANTSLALLVRISPLWGQPMDQVLVAARGAAQQVARLLAVAIPSAEVATICSRPRLQALLTLPRLADLAELRARWMPVSDTLALPTPIPGVPDLAFLLDELRAEGCPALLSLVFEPADGVPSLRPLLQLAQETAGAAVGALLSPTDEDSGPSQYLDDAITSEQDSMSRERLGRAVLSQWLMRKLPELRDAFRIAVRLGAAAPLSASFLRLWAVEFAGEGRLVADRTWRRSPHPLAPGAEAQRPIPDRDSRFAADPIEWETARRNFEYLEFTPWGVPFAARQNVALRGLDGETTIDALASLVSKEALAHLIPLPTAASWLPTHVTPLPINVDTLPTDGARLGTTLAGRTRVAVRWPEVSRTLQALVLGSTGVGKSTLVANLILEDIRAGHAVVALDPHGQLIDALLPRIPQERAADVILFDVEDVERPIGINPLDLQTDEERARFVSSFIGQLRQLFDPHNQAVVGPVAMQGLRAAMQGAMSLPDGGTLLECYRFFTDEDYLHRVMSQMSDHTAAAYFRKYLAMSERERAEYALHIISKLSEWCADPVMRRIIGQRKSSFSFAEAMNSRKIVLLRLASGFIGTEKSTFLGHTFLPMIFQAALARASLPDEERQFTSVWLDEAGIFGSEVIASMLAQSRKYNIAASLVGQHFAQFLPIVRDAILANANNIFAFRVGVPDALLLERTFSSTAVDESYLTQLPRGVATTRIMLADGTPSAPFTLETEPLAGTPNHELAREIREFSRELYGRPRAEVDAEREQREAKPPSPPRAMFPSFLEPTGE